MIDAYLVDVIRPTRPVFTVTSNVFDPNVLDEGVVVENLMASERKME